jgi:hypothetical protein
MSLATLAGIFASGLTRSSAIQEDRGKSRHSAVGALQQAESAYSGAVVNQQKGGDPVSHCPSPQGIAKTWIIVRAGLDRA